ncbi:MAG: glyceraldehyde 3-phosphate dehydrogenase NAD-binding domain-containing protein [Patescibacteria group bacterium]
MSRLKVGLNGFGRIGSSFTRIALERDSFDISLINTRSSSSNDIANLLQNDYVYGKFTREVKASENALMVSDKEIGISKSSDIENIPWKEYGVNIVIDATGAYLTEEELRKHLSGDIKKVILTAISKTENIPHVVFGVNDKDFDFKNSDIISNCSCTTNSVAILYKVLNDNFGIKSSFFTTAHAYTRSQISLEDLSSLKATQLNIIPATTGASKGVFRVLPELDGKIQGMALRVPVPTVSFSDITATLDKPASKDELNNIFKEQSLNEMSGILGYEEEFKTSSDLIGSTYSSVFDSNYTETFDNNFVKITAWYDNEWGYSSRIADLVERISQYI